MAIAIIIVVFASFLWGITNHIDKFMITRIDERGSSIKVLLVFSTFVAGIVFTPLWLILSKFQLSITILSLGCTFGASIVYILATYFYFKALEKNDASIVVVMFQLIPVFSYILALILFDEKLLPRQIIGSIIIILSAVIISFDFNERNNKKKLEALLLMTLSSLLYSIYFILLDIAMRNSAYYSCAFWYQIGLLLLGIILLLIKSFRTRFILAIKNNGKRYFVLNSISEIINLVANLLVNFANVLIPIALVNVLNGFQGMFAFIIGVLGTIFLPKYFNEDLKRNVVIQKISCILLGIIGLIILFI